MDLTAVPKTHNMLSEHLHKIKKFIINFSNTEIDKQNFIRVFPLLALSLLCINPFQNEDCVT